MRREAMAAHAARCAYTHTTPDTDRTLYLLLLLSCPPLARDVRICVDLRECAIGFGLSTDHEA
eukprot:4070074-Pleurochrysis_carterae.AAC.4